MMLFGFSDSSASTSVLDSIPGVDTLVSYIQDKAKAGAEGAIPDIQNQVKATVTPYIITIAVLAGVAAMFGISAYLKVNKRLQQQAAPRSAT